MKKYIKYSLILIQCIIISKAVIAQDNPSDLTQNSIELEAYLDIYYSYDFARPESYQKQLYFYNYNRQNSFQLNLGYLKVKWLREKYRANLVLQAGTYAEDNYTAEPGLLKHVFEANAGLALNSKNTFWLDVGIFSSHIGFESANAFDNWTLTRSLAAENSPYYLSGLKMSYDVTPRFQLTSLVCNGWQRIQKVAGNSLLSFGTQVKITPKEGWLINWSSFIGTDDPDSLRRMRYFNNFYAQMQYSKAWSVILGMDLGFQQVSKGSADFQTWMSPVAIVRYKINETWATALRGEYYRDIDRIIVTSSSKGFTVSGISINLDYAPLENILCRVEGRWLHGVHQIFNEPENPDRNNFSMTASFALKMR